VSHHSPATCHFFKYTSDKEIFGLMRHW
jgi:hypothetical protein